MHRLPLLLPHLEVVKVVGAPRAYPPTLMANPPLLHTWLLLGTSTYQVCRGLGCDAPFVSCSRCTGWMSWLTTSGKLHSDEATTSRAQAVEQLRIEVGKGCSILSSHERCKELNQSEQFLSAALGLLCITLDSKQLFLSLPSSWRPLWWRGRAATWDASLKSHHSSLLLALEMEGNGFTEWESEKALSHWKKFQQGTKMPCNYPLDAFRRSNSLSFSVKYCFIQWWNNPEGWEIETCGLFFTLSIVSHASAVIQYVAVDPTQSVRLSGSRDMELD